MTNINFKQFEDKFGNLIQEFEVIKYEKYANDTWMEIERRESGLTYYNVDGKLYYRHNSNSSFELNMDFSSPNCEVCYVIGKPIEGKRKITGNYILGKFKAVEKNYSLKKQTYSDNTSYYYISDSYGQTALVHGSRKIEELIVQLEHEVKTYYDHIQEYNKESFMEVIEMNKVMIQLLENELIWILFGLKKY